MHRLRPLPMAQESGPGGETAIIACPSLRRIDTLQKTHNEALVRSIANVCETPIAKTTYAQILDGFPTVPLIDGGNAPRSLPRSHPSRTQHLELCEGVMERLADLQRSYDIQTLSLESEAMTEYNSAALGSRLFNTRLIELTARAAHQIAVDIALLDESRHKDDELGAWVPPDSDQVFWQASPSGPPPTWFRLRWYKDYQQYPHGASDMAGYWAENQILGGVVLFDRRTPSDASYKDFAGEIDPDAVYLHSEKIRVTYRICKLLDEQKKQLLDFLRADPEEASQICPLPLRCGKNNLQRVDPEELLTETGIYRDKWERRPFPDRNWDRRTRDVYSDVEYTSFEDWRASRRRARDREDRIARNYQDD